MPGCTFCLGLTEGFVLVCQYAVLDGSRAPYAGRQINRYSQAAVRQARQASSIFSRLLLSCCRLLSPARQINEMQQVSSGKTMGEMKGLSLPTLPPPQRARFPVPSSS